MGHRMARRSSPADCPVPGLATTPLLRHHTAQLWLPKPLKFSVDHWNKGVTSRTQAQLDSTDLIIERAGITDGMKVLDIGAGYGMIGQHIARRFPRCEIVSLTAQREAADYLKDQCAAEGITNVQSIAADVVDVRSTSGSCPGSGDTVLDDDFDVVLAIEFIEHARNAEAMLAHLSQFARPRTGVLLLQTWVSPQVPMDMTGHFMEQFLGRAMCLQPHTMRLFQTEWKMEREWALPPTDGRTTFRRHAIALTRNKKRLTYERAKFFCEHTDGLEMGDALQKAGKQMTMIQIAHCMTSAFYGQGFLVTQHIKMRRR